MALKFRKFYKEEKDEAQEKLTEGVVKEPEMPAPETIEKPISKKERSFAIFAVGPEWYGLDLDSIIEILHNYEIIPVPHLPPSFAGVINLRGTSVPVVVLAKLFKFDTRADSINVCIITTVDETKIGLLVDSDVEIVNFEKGRLYPLPNCYTKEESEFLEGIFWLDERFIGILRLKEALNLLTEWRLEDEIK